MKLSRTIIYAVQAILHLARAAPGVPVPCRKLAASGGMPERFLLQILRTLVNHGLLCSTRGVDGGYYLMRSAHQITLGDIVEAFDNSLDATMPMFDGLAAGTHNQLLGALRSASRMARIELQKVTIAHLLRSEEATVLGTVAVPLEPTHITQNASPA